jgi:hypothetical protein
LLLGNQEINITIQIYGSIPARLGAKHWLFTGISGMAQLRLLRVPEGLNGLNVRRVLCPMFG